MPLRLTALAPLSKCYNLEYLDLSADGYGVSLEQILGAVGHLENLNTLKLPTDVFFRKDGFPPVIWPDNLRYLQITDTIPETARTWEAILQTWPDSLTTLSIQGGLHLDSLACLTDCKVKLDVVQRLEIGVSRDDASLPLTAISSTNFPALRHLSIPAMVVFVGGAQTFSAPINVETLELTPRVEIGAPEQWQLDDFESLLSDFPFLHRIEIAEKNVQLDDEDKQYISEQLRNRLKREASARQRSRAGLVILSGGICT